MLFEFRSRATGTVIMTDAVGRKVFEVLGREPEPRGILTVEQLPEAIGRLRAAIAAERAEIARSAGEARAGGTPAEEPAEPPSLISFAQRALPLIEMFERAAAARRDVTWGV